MANRITFRTCLTSLVLSGIHIILLWISAIHYAQAQPAIEEEQRLNFGLLAVSSNASVSRLELPSSGSTATITGQFVIVSGGSTGVYRFTGFPANTNLSVSIDSTTLFAGSTGIPEPLSVDNYDFLSLNTNSDGEAELTLGARLNTTGNGVGYVDAQFNGTTSLRVDYWQPDVSAFVSNSKSIEMVTELRSTLTIDEEQPLNFGTLFARSDIADQAVFNLHPTGSYSVSEPGNSRLVSLTAPSNGVLRISGAAPNYNLFITPQVADVLLEHIDTPGSAPHFVLSNLVTTPDTTGFSDNNGELIVEIGGELKTELTASPVIYPSGLYEGTYELTVSY